ncbi:uncharacterized protein MEPE_05401 [Melanopsichium pennsylvanicum]|uniref:Uncharacterized protein n=2 Tax=Melanopsichium pennsylvanicum TaxID=63383 RepID=A0AAJ4XQS5_9BASI|nr:hypothetical protein BN887_04772 [Melanopsichium pennsylvanicum 4]SNX86692.1 uncharacterized protein MEPE_05401 [Melanopsichium pennsylvanicum]
MAASTTMRPHSATSSGASTPWLSPEASSSTWSGSYATSTDLSRRPSSGSSSTNSHSINSEPSSSRDPHSQEWWEHVLPPGQLAERLRKAQRSSSASRRRNNPALANATPSERSAWKRLSGLPKEIGQHDRSEASTATSSCRSSFQACTTTAPRSALKSKSSQRSQDASAVDFGDASHSVSSAEVSGDELFGCASTAHQSPQTHARLAFPSGLPTSSEHDSSSRRRAGVRTTSNSPELASSQWSVPSWASPLLPSAFDSSRSGSRTTGGRRMRVMSEDGLGSSVSASGQTFSSSSYRLPNSQSAVHLNQFVNSNDTSTWSNIAADRTRAKFPHLSLPATPELSSDEAADVTNFTTTTTTQRTRKISTTKTTIFASSSKASSPPTILRSHFDRPNQPPCPPGSEENDESTSPGRYDRHVSFDQASDIPRRASVDGYTEAMTSSYSAFNFGSSREYVSPFDSLPPRSNSTRRPRQGVRISGRRTTSFSLPGSRRGSIRESSSPHSDPASVSSSGFGHRRAASISDAMLLDSLNVAHNQLASAGNLALTLTRQLSAPLRPVFRMTLFLSISSITVLSLACFLCASYMLTAWDDVSKRTHKVGRAAGKTKHKFERTLDWGLKMLGPNDAPTRGNSKPASKSFAEAPSGPRSARGASGTTSNASSKGDAESRGSKHSVLLWPARMAWSGATTVAYHMTPATISKMFEPKTAKAKPSNLPPRPPLSTLLPSILFTLLLALGAGLNSFLASRRAATAAAEAGGVSGAKNGTHLYSMPSSNPSSPGLEYVHLASGAAAASPFAGRPQGSMKGPAVWEKDAKRRSFGGVAPSANSTNFVK